MKLPGNNNSIYRNYSLITALETIYVTWFFYVLLLIAYDESLIGEKDWLTYCLFASFLVWSLYLFYRLLKYNKIAPAIRYAIPTVIIFWNCIEILGRWKFFKEIWLFPEGYVLELVIILVSFIIFALLLMFMPKEITVGEL